MTIFALHSTVIPLEDWPFGNNHLHDLMAMPILLGWIDLITSRDTKAGRIATSTGFYFALTVVCAAIWECLVPALKPSSVGDWLDAAAYVTGSCFYIFMRAAFLARSSRFFSLQGNRT